MRISGKEISLQLREQMREEVVDLVARYGRKPCLAVILVGDNPASVTYVRNKVKASEYCGIDSLLITLPETTTENELLQHIAECNANDKVDAIIVQLPLPAHMDASKVIFAIHPEKDVDGFHPSNVARLWLEQPVNHGGKLTYNWTIPCTPRGIIALLEHSGVALEGKRAVVVGRSNIVGKPVAKLLMDRNCTVTICHSKTQNLSQICKDADILVVAVGHAHLIQAECVKKGAVVIDVGINRLPDGRLCGDVNTADVEPIAHAVTPVPGGVGPMTVTMLMRNTIDCYLRRMNTSSNTTE